MNEINVKNSSKEYMEKSKAVDEQIKKSETELSSQVETPPESHQGGVNKQNQKIEKGDNSPITFNVEPFRKECLINGYDDIALSLKKTKDVEAYLIKKKKETPWLFSA